MLSIHIQAYILKKYNQSDRAKDEMYFSRSIPILDIST